MCIGKLQCIPSKYLELDKQNLEQKTVSCVIVQEVSVWTGLIFHWRATTSISPMLKPGRFNMLHTSIEVLAKQNKLRPRTQQSQRRDGLPVLRKREPLKAVRTPFTNEVFYPWPEEEELRPETPFVKTRLQRQVLGSGGSRSNVPSETADLFGSNGMYKRSIGFESPTLILRRANSREKNRCGTPLPLDQPLTKLCWNNGLGIGIHHYSE